MKKSILFVSGTLWAFSVLVGKSCPSAIYPFNTDDSHDGAILAKNSNKLDLPRDLSQPIIARFAREVEGEDPTESQSSKFHLLIIIIPVVMGVVVIIIIVLVVCYMCRRSERGSCISNEWLIWCGLMKRSNPSSVRYPGDHRSANPSHAPSVGRGVRYEPAILLTDSQHQQTPQRVEMENPTGARPSERSPSLPDTPNTGNSSLPTDDDWSPHSRTPATEHQSGTPKFTYPNPKGGHDGSITVEQTRAPHRAMYPTLENISEKENTGDGRDNGRADRSGSDDDVFIKPVSFGDHSNQEWPRKSPSNASPGDTYRVSGNDVHVHFHSPVETVHVGDKLIKETKYNFFPKDGTDTINNNTCAFHRFALERKTH